MRKTVVTVLTGLMAVAVVAGMPNSASAQSQVIIIIGNGSAQPYYPQPYPYPYASYYPEYGYLASGYGYYNGNGYYNDYYRPYGYWGGRW